MNLPRRALLALALTVVAASCGGDDDGGEDATGSDGLPERVVVLDTPQLDAALSLGVTPVGAVRPAADAEFPEYLEGADDIADVGTIEAPNLEAIAKLEPDLILSSELRHADLYDELSEIATTVFSETTGGTWKADYLLFAEAMGRKAEAEEMLEAYETRAAAIGAELGTPADTTVGIVRFLPDEIRVYGPESFSGSVLTDVGVSLPEAVRDVRDDIAIYPSAEQVDQASADVIYVTTWGDPTETTKSAVQGGPLWPTLPAVQQGRVFDVSDDVWMLGIGVLGADALLDDVERTLLSPPG
jgi:iron complex transport system substrate-binding protein